MSEADECIAQLMELYETALEDAKASEAYAAELEAKLSKSEALLAKAVCFLISLDKHGVYTTNQLEELVAELKGKTDEK